MSEPCPDCISDVGFYNFDRDCCMVRFLVHVPTKTMRIGYLRWYAQKFGAERSEKLKALLIKAWDKKREEALNFGKAVKAVHFE